MSYRLAKLPTAVYIPAVQAVQGRAAYCVTQQVLVGYTSVSGGNLWGLARGSTGGSAGGSSSTGTSMVYVPPDPLNMDYEVSWQNIPNAILNGSANGVQINGPSQGGGYSSQGGGYSSQLKPRYEMTKTCYPAIQAVAGQPARIDYTAHTGWNSGARTRKVIPQFGSFKGALLSTLAATQFGFSDAYFNHTYSYMTHSIVARPGTWSIVERGITVATGALAANAVVELRRLSGKVIYLANGVELYTSNSVAMGEIYGAALLYSLGDGVDDARITALDTVSQLSIKAPAFRLLADEGASAAYADIQLPMWRLAAQMGPRDGENSLSLVMPAFKLICADRPFSFMSVKLPMPQITATMSQPERELSQLVLRVPAPILSATLISGQSLQYDKALPAPLLVGADRLFSYMNVTLPGIVRIGASEPYMPPGEIDGLDAVIAHDTASLESALLLLAVDSLGVTSSEADIFIVFELLGMDSLGFADNASLGQMVEMLAMERVAINSTTAAAQRQALQYAVNVTTGAMTTYAGFDFQGFTRCRGETYAWRPDGLYRIGAGTDNGAFIQALADFGASDFGSKQVKRSDSLFLGVRTDGRCYLRVQADNGPERTYEVREGNNVSRARLAKGVAGRYWSIKLELTDASFAEVDSLEVSIGATQRRIFGARN